MTDTASSHNVNTDDEHLLVEDVVKALTGGDLQRDEENVDDLRERMEGAAHEFDERTAFAFGRALLDSLCEDPGNLRQLEALLILGLAHPDVLERHRISLAVEGRRLAVLLERAGQVARARGVLELLASRLPEERTIDHELAGILRRSGNTGELVERYLRRAEKAVEEESVSEAIPWLQEILLLDRTRRDVARMIRDLRYQEADRHTRGSRRSRVLIMVVLVAGVLTAVAGRELSIREEYANLAPVESNNLEMTLYQRKESIDQLLSNHRFWFGIFAVTKERDSLRLEIAEFEREKTRRDAADAAITLRRLQTAEGARLRGLKFSERGDFSHALTAFQEALEFSPAAWEHRPQVERDVEALRAWKGRQEQ